MVLRMDDATTMNRNVTSMANWNGWWAPGYTQAPSSGFQITYETGADGQQYAVITAASVPARTWATVTFSGVVPASNWAVGGQLMTYSATTMDFPYACEPPLPAYQTTTVADPSSETSVTLSNIGDAWPTNTQPAPTTGTAAFPTGWTGSFDNSTGALSVTVPAGTAAGTYTIPVTVTYASGETRTVEATVVVDPVVQDVTMTVNQGDTALSPAYVDHTGQPVPAEATFALDSNAPEWITMGDNGRLTVSPDVTVPPGTYAVPVTVTLANGNTQEVLVNVTVVNPSTPTYSTIDPVNQGGSATIPTPTNSDGSPLPTGASFAAGNGAPAWATVNADGSISVNPGAAVPAGTYTVPVDITYPDGTDGLVEASVTVANPNDPTYEPLTVNQGSSESSVIPTTDGTPVPEGTTFAIASSWNNDGFAGDISIDDSGVVTVSPAPDATPRLYVIPVLVTYPDGSTETITLPVTVVNPNDPDYTDTTVNQGETVTVPAPLNPGGGALPAGTSFVAGDGTPDWATVNANGTITVNPSSSVVPGTYLVPVRVTYPDGTSEVIDASVTVSNPNSAVYQSTTVNQGQTATVPTPTNEDGTALPAGTTFAAAGDGPSWATLNPDGTITLTPGDAVPRGLYSMPVTVTYPDGTQQTISAEFVVYNSNVPRYGDAPTVNQGESGTILRPVNENGTALPDGTSFATGDGWPSWAELNEDGSITVTPGYSIPEGSYSLPVIVTTPDGASFATVAPVNVKNPFTPTYEGPTQVNQGSSVTIATPDSLPEGTTFVAGDGTPGWATVHDDGTITVNPGSSVVPGLYSVPVNVTTPDGKTVVVNALVEVANPNEPAYAPVEPIAQGTTVVAPAPTNPDGSALPDGTTFQLSPSWTLSRVTVRDDGSVELSPSPRSVPDTYSIPVIVTYPDGTLETIILQVETVNPNDPNYTDINVEQGTTGTVERPVNSNGSAPPDGTTYGFGDGVPSWASLDAASGSITVTPGVDVVPGTYTIPVVVAYLDGTTEVIDVAVTVTNSNHPVFGDPVTVNQGDTVTVPAPANPADDNGNVTPLPEGTQFEIVVPWPPEASLNPDGSIEFVATPETQPGTYPLPVKVTYPDGTAEVIVATVVVANPNAPVYEGPTPVDQGQSVTIPAPLTPGVDGADPQPVPPGSTFALAEDQPDWISVDTETGEITVTPGYAVVPGDYTIPVTVTYPDGTTAVLDTVVTVSNPFDPSYQAPGAPLAQGDTLTIARPSTGTGVSWPEGTTFNLVHPGFDTVTIDPTTGVITLSPSFEVPAGTYDIVVAVTTPDGIVHETTVSVTIVNTIDPVYSPVTVKQGDSLNVGLPTNSDGKPLPEGSTISADNLPDWITINDNGGLTLAPGTNVAPGTYTVDVLVHLPDGSVIETPLTVTVVDADAPFIEPIGNQVLPTDQPMTPIPVTVTDAQGSVIVTVVGLPPGLSYDPGSGAIIGTPTTAGSYPVAITATDAAGNQYTESFVITIVDPTYVPVSVKQGQTVTIPLPSDADGTLLPPGTTISATDLPDWVTINDNGTITASPGLDTPEGDVIITVTVTLPNGTTTEIPLSITVVHVDGPAIQWIPNQQVTAGQSLPVIPVIVTGGEGTVTVEVTGLPEGVTYDPATGEITGTPTVPGTYTVTLTATDDNGRTFTETFIINVTEPVDPGEPTYVPVTVRQGDSVAIPLPTDSDGSPLPAGTTISATDLPDWITITDDGHVIASPGSDIAPGTYTVIIDVHLIDGTTIQVPLEITVVGPNAPALSWIPNQVVPVGQPITAIPVIVTGGEGTVTVEVTGLPEGLTYDPATGEITGIPTVPGTYTVTVTATDEAGNTFTETFIITVEEPAPPIHPQTPIYLPVTVTQGGTVTVDMPTYPDGSPLPEGTTISGDDLPDWIVVGEDGTITVSPGTDIPGGLYVVPITVHLPDGSTITIPLQITVVDASSPVIAPIDNQDVTVGEEITPIHIEITGGEGTITVDVTGLPDGVTYDPATGIISGTPTTPGSYTVTVTATDENGNTFTQTFIINVTDPSDPTDPTDPTDPGDPGKPTDPGEPAPKPDESGKLPQTGAQVLSLATIAALLLGCGAYLLRRRHA